MKRLTTEEFIQKARTVHGDKYDYSEVEYINNATKVKILCFQHKIFVQRPNDHLSGNGCPKCSGKEKSNVLEFIEKAKAVHGDKYDYSEVEYINNRTKVKISCSQHGVFEQTPNSHLSGSGCPECSGKSKSNTLEFIEKAKSVHGDKYDYSEIDYIGALEKVKILCSQHGVFEQSPASHLSGNGCSKCFF